MKRSGLVGIALLAGFITLANAQGLAGKGYRFALNLNHDTMDLPSTVTDADDAWEMGYEVTLFVDYNFTDRFAAQPEISYLKRIWDNKWDTGIEPFELHNNEYTQHILNFTALFKYRLRPKGFTPACLGGVQVGQTIHLTNNGEDSYTITTPEQPYGTGDGRKYIRDFNRTHWAIVGGVALEIPLGYGRVYTDARIAYDLNDNYTDRWAFDNLRITTVSLSLGYLY